MELHYSYSCEPCTRRFIGPALHSLLETVPTQQRDKCYGCGTDNTIDTPVFAFSYWYPWEEEEHDGSSG